MDKKSCRVSENAGSKTAAVTPTSSPSKTEKKCHLCNVVKPVTEFWTSKGHNDGFQSRCIPCEKKYQHDRRDKYRPRQYRLRKKWREENPERNKEYNRQYARDNKEIWMAKNRRRTAKQRENSTYYISKKQLKKLYRGPCVYCGATGKMTLDHVVPINRGGAHSIGNLVPACGPCNFSKGQKLLIEWKIYKNRKGN